MDPDLEEEMVRQLTRIANALENIASAFAVASTPTEPSQVAGVTQADD
jgi:hypothetical protein